MARIDVTDSVVPRYLHPHVNTVVNDNTYYSPEVSPVPTNNVYMIGVFQSERGRGNEFIDVNNASALNELFGAPDVLKFGLQQLAASSALNSGVVSMKAMRVVPQAGKGFSEAQSAKYANLLSYANLGKNSFGGSKAFPSAYSFNSVVTTIIQSFTISDGGTGFAINDVVSPVGISIPGVDPSMLPSWIVTGVTGAGGIKSVKVSSYGTVPASTPLGSTLSVDTATGSNPATFSNVVYANIDTQTKVLNPITPMTIAPTGKDLTVTITLSGNAVDTLVIDAGTGTNYKVGDYLTINTPDSNAMNAYFIITAVDPSTGEPTTANLITGGNYDPTIVTTLANVPTKYYASGDVFAVESIVPNTGGVDYQVDELLVIDQIDVARSPVFKVTNISGAGIVTTLEVASSGSMTADDVAMLSASGVSLIYAQSGGIGTGLTADIVFSNEIHWNELTVDVEALSVKGAYDDNFLRTHLESYRSQDGLQVPLFYVRTDGLGKYGNDYRFRIRRDVNVEADMGLKAYAFEVLENKTSLTLKATYSGTLIYSPRYTTVPVMVKDIIAEINPGYAFINAYNDEEGFETIYNKYLDIVKANNNTNNPNLQSWLNKMFSTDPDVAKATQLLAGIPTIANGGITKDAVLLQYTVEGVAADTYNKALLSKLSAMREAIATSIDIDEFDPIFGYMVGSNDKIPYLELTFTSLNDYSIFNSQTGIINVGKNTINDMADIDGIQMLNGSDGILDSYVPGSNQYKAVVDQLYAHAFSGYFDPNIKSPTRIPYDVLIDCDYSLPVKQIMYNTNVLRDDALLYLDMGTELKHMVDVENIVNLNNYGAFNSRTCSLNFQNYLKKDPISGKNIRVPITFFFWEYLPLFIQLNGTHTPFVFNYAVLSGHVRNTLQPEVSANVIWQQGYQYQSTEEAEYKEFLNTYRLNYFVTTGDNVFKRGIQNTTQKDYSLLLEENNVRICWELKRSIERDLNEHLFMWNDAQARANYTQRIQSIFASWVGTRIESFDVQFTVTPWEAERNIMRCTVDIAPRKFAKIITFVLNINKPSASV